MRIFCRIFMWPYKVSFPFHMKRRTLNSCGPYMCGFNNSVRLAPKELFIVPFPRYKTSFNLEQLSSKICENWKVVMKVNKFIIYGSITKNNGKIKMEMVSICLFYLLHASTERIKQTYSKEKIRIILIQSSNYISTI